MALPGTQAESLPTAGDPSTAVGMTRLACSVGTTNLASTPAHQSTPAPNQAARAAPQKSSQNLVSAHDADP